MQDDAYWQGLALYGKEIMNLTKPIWAEQYVNKAPNSNVQYSSPEYTTAAARTPTCKSRLEETNSAEGSLLGKCLTRLKLPFLLWCALKTRSRLSNSINVLRATILKAYRQRCKRF